MASSNVDVICAEYPFVSKFRSRWMSFHVKIKRWDEDFLKTSTVWGDSESGTGGIRKIRFLDANGVTVSCLCPWWRQFLGEIVPGFFVPETIGQALRFMNDEKLKRIRYVVMVDVGWREIILWKAPRDYDNMSDWLRSKLCQPEN